MLGCPTWPLLKSLPDFTQIVSEILSGVFDSTACCPKRDFYTHTPFPPPTPKKRQQTFVLHTQKNSASFVLHTQKRGKKGCKKCGKKGGKKSLFLNLSCCCLETGLVISESLLDLAFLESRSIMTRPITLHSKAKLRTWSISMVTPSTDFYSLQHVSPIQNNIKNNNFLIFIHLNFTLWKSI